MHGAHPDRLAFKLDATTLFLLRALLFSLPLSPSFSHSALSRLTSISFLPYKMPPSEHPSVAVFQATSPNVTFFFSSHSVALARLSFLFFFYFSSQQRDKDAHVLPHPRKGCLLGETDTARVTGQLSVRVSEAHRVPQSFGLLETVAKFD